MFQLIAENKKGDRLTLTNNRAFDILEIQGLNPAPAVINTVAVSGLDGTRYNSSRVEQRNIVLTLAIHFPIEQNRLKLYGIFMPKSWIRLFYKTSRRDVYIDGYVETFENNPFTQSQQPQISIICPQPFWKANGIVNVDFSRSVALFEFPFSIPSAGIEFSTLETTTSATVNVGEAETGAIVYFYAADAVVNPKIYNNTTQQFFGVDITMQSGDLITINSNKGEKAVTLLRGTTTTNLLDDRTDGSEWLMFAAGENLLTIDAASGLDDLRASLSVVQLYEGV